ncbi:MAG: thioredoxin domain-containing protein [Patescibacteria group bacterium]|nr:thioredoxin domain-containing protein [Patescibacteria group bacterium]
MELRDNAIEEGPSRGRRLIRSGWNIVRWAVFILLFAAAAFFGWRLWYYYDKLRRGEIVNLPQFQGQFTAADQAPTLTSVYADRKVVEVPARPTLGADADKAKLTIVEFGDFGCPFSKDASDAIRSVMARHGDKVRFIYRHYPVVSLHPDAELAAEAAECAFEQGKFWPYHDKLYANQGAQKTADLLRYGQEVGLNATQFERCLAEGRYRVTVDDDVVASKIAAVRGTPTFFFNGEEVAGAIPEQTLETIVTRLTQ